MTDHDDSSEPPHVSSPHDLPEPMTKRRSALARVTASIPRPPRVRLLDVPKDFVALDNRKFRGTWPNVEELAMLPEAVEELARLTGFGSAFGSTVPSHAVTVHIFRAANEWSSLRRELAQATAYAQSQESRVWVQLRALMAQVKRGLDAVAPLSPDVPEKVPSLVRMVRAKGESAKRGAAKRRANAEGEKAARVREGKVGERVE